MELYSDQTTHIIEYNCCRKTLPGPETGLLSPVLPSEMNCPRRHMCWQNKRFYWGRARAESMRVREPGEALCHLAHSLGLYGDGTRFWVVCSRSFWFRVLPSSARLVQPRWMPERKILGGGQTGVCFCLFLNSSSWWRLISSAFLTRTSCCKTIHANGYYGAWPGWVVSVSMLPLTQS